MFCKFPIKILVKAHSARWRLQNAIAELLKYYYWDFCVDKGNQVMFTKIGYRIDRINT